VTGEPAPGVGVAALVVDHDRLLLVRRGRGPAQGEWALPGGRVEHGETLPEAVTREVAEETGVEVVCGRLVDWTERIEAVAHWVVLVFEATLVGADQVAAGDDAAEARWVELHEVAELHLVEGLAELLHAEAIIATFT
jgi:8-oxo-dGTP diphosphatase